MEHVTLTIDGMSCDACVRHVTNALQAVPGVRVQRVAVGSATVAYDPAKASPAALAEAVREAGYTVRPEARP
jgi:copper chaperone CopZ